MLKLKKFLREMPQSDRRILVLSALLMLLFGGVLVDDRLFNLMDGDKSAVPIGSILRTQSDVRQKSSNGLAWTHTSVKTTVRIGDSIFTGRNSEASVKVQDNEIYIGENSLINFKKYKGIDVNNLNFGTFNIKVTGNIKVMVDGELMNLKGHRTEIQAVVAKNQKVKWKAIKGDTKVEALGKEEKISAHGFTKPQPVTHYPPAPIRDAPEPKYYWKVRDIYTSHDQRYRLRKELPQWVNPNYSIEWKDQDKGPYTVQVATDEDFIHDLISDESQERIYKVPRLRVGNNFWRVSRDKEQWSRTEIVTMLPEFLKESPQITSASTGLTLTDTVVHYQLKWKPVHNASSYFIEASTSPQFFPETTAIARTELNSFNVDFTKPGTFFFRIRAVDMLDQVSEGSGVALHVVEPPLLAAPLLPKKVLAFKSAKQPLTLPWKGPEGAKSFEVEVVDVRTNKALLRNVTEQKLDLDTLPNGPYSYQVTAIDPKGRRGASSVIKPFTVSIPAPVVRKPAQTISQKFEDRDRSPYMNAYYPANKVQLEGAGFTMYSSEQVGDGSDAPLAATLGVRSLNWFNNLGVEGFLKAKIFNYNRSASSESPMGAEVRVHNRWKFGLHWGTILRELQVSLFLGAEAYRNSGTEAFSPQYNLVKAGTLVTFPLGRRWDTGGELVYGHGFDGSTKYELSGYLNYYIQKRWTYGAGYRIHLFQAGSSSTPALLPYREGYVELYSALRYLY